MTKAQKELIREAYAKEVDGEGWRKRMERWLGTRAKGYFEWVASTPWRTTWVEPKYMWPSISQKKRIRLARRNDIAMINAALGTSYK